MSMLIIFSFICVIYQLNTVSVNRKMRIYTIITINQLSCALKAYKNDYGRYPPNDIAYGGKQEGRKYKYRNDVLIKYLGGDDFGVQYFEFSKKQIKNKYVYLDAFGGCFWYRNFEDEKINAIIIDNEYPLHPWYNIIFYKSFQLYSKAEFKEKKGKAYCTKPKTKDKFGWITNYIDNKP